MSSNNHKIGKKNPVESRDGEVDELLRAAQDDVLLKLSLNSHIAHLGSSSSEFSAIDPDLDSRFQALKTHQTKSKSTLDASAISTGREKKNPESVLHEFDESDDLFARFGALKDSSVPSHSFSSSAADVGVNSEVQQQLKDDDEDEVEKLIRWAIDSARLDPSPPTDSDDGEGEHDDDDDDDTDDSDDEDDDHRKVDAGKKSKRK